MISTEKDQETVDAQSKENEINLKKLKIKDNVDNDTLKQKEKVKFVRFLHISSEKPFYDPIDKFYTRRYEKCNIKSIFNLIALESPENIVNLIVKVKEDGTFIQSAPLVFALAICAVNNDKSLNIYAYKALPKVCSDAKDLFLFIKFLNKLQPDKPGGKFAHCKGIKKAISEWYLSQTPSNLVRLITRQKKEHGWSHYDVFRLIHIKSKSPEHNFIVKYVLGGYDKVSKEFENTDNTFIKDTLKYFKALRDFTHEKNMVVAAKQIENHLFPLESISPKQRRNIHIWTAILPKLDVKELIEVLPTVSALGYFHYKSNIPRMFIDTFENYYSLRHCNVHPSEVLIAKSTYDVHSEIVKEFRVKAQLPVKTNDPYEPITLALCGLYNNLCKILEPTNKKFLIAKNCHFPVMMKPCWRSYPVWSDEAQFLMIRSILIPETKDNVTILGTRSDSSIFEIANHPDVYHDGAFLKDVNCKDFTSPDIIATISYAEQKKIDADVIIVFTNLGDTKKQTRHALSSYKQTMGKEDVKLVVVSLTGITRNLKHLNTDDCLTIYGFDKYVCKLIKSFVLGAY
uniref:TROVE domain-containing protein n=2 Tax=Clastoptera arizonana TaxID=38151 RepID=A0A1B6DHJ6_9HEMI